MQRLTKQQLAFFDTFGFIVLPGLLADCIGQIIDTFEKVWEERGGGHAGREHDGKARSCIVPFIDQHPRLCALLDDPRIEGAIASILGDDFNYLGSDGNFYVGDTAWHSDGGAFCVNFIKVALYLDPLTRDTGALRVIPGSHRFGDRYADDLSRLLGMSESLLGVHGRDIPAYAIETQPGDVAIFNHKTKHAAYGGSARRRMFTINCSQRFPDDKLDELRTYIAHGARFLIDRMYGQAMMDTASPQRMVHLEQAMANDGHLAALSAEARQRQAEPARG